MTEREWLAATDPTPLLVFLRDKTSDRKFRLFGVACCRRVWHLFSDERCRAIVDTVEAHTEGQESDDVLRAASASAYDLARHMDAYLSEYSQEHVDAARAAAALSDPAPDDADFSIGPEGVSEYTAAATADVAVPERWEGDNMEPWTVAHAAERSIHCDLLRDIVGNPFRPVAADPVWLTTTVVQLATGIHNEKAFDRLPILADALQDAGCDNADILNHCRSEVLHVQGCWVVDLILGKE